MIKDLVKQSRSYRAYDESRKISKEELASFVDCARLAPSSVNGQPFRYVLAYEQKHLDLIQPLTAWARALPELTLPEPGKYPTAFIIICQDTELDDNLDRYQRDVGIVAQTMLLAATEAGLGGIMIGNFNPKRIAEALELPKNLQPMLVVAFGKPAEEIELVEIEEGENVAYYRDENNRHFVPKRKLEDIIVDLAAE